MKLKAIDTLHISAVRSDSIRPGDEFEVEDGAGRSLVTRGLAITAGEKAAVPPKNKADRKLANKAG